MTDEARELVPISGHSRDGRPLAFHRAAPPDLAPWIARLFVTVVDQPSDQTLACGLLNDTPFVRLIVRGDWTADAANGRVHARHGPLLFGAHSQVLPVCVTGPFATFGFALVPGALSELSQWWGMATSDEVLAIATGDQWAAWRRIADFDDHSPDYWLDWLEAALRARLLADQPRRPPALIEAFDRAAFSDPSRSIRDVAASLNVSPRQLERLVGRAFGLTPKHVMRRARVLDMASQILGFADRDEAEAFALRFYDQSHLIRDFRTLLRQTPSHLARVPQPILALGLEARQARRLELLGKPELPWR